MRKYLVLEKLDDNSNVAIYSPKFEGEIENEFEKFLRTYSSTPKYRKDLDIILSRIEKIQRDGAQDRHFRYESKMNEKIRAIPPNIESSKLRLYCICFNEKLIILGGGGVKHTRTYQEDPALNEQVERLKLIHKQLLYEIQKNPDVLSDDVLESDIRFYINEDTN